MKQYILNINGDASCAALEAREAIDAGYRWLQITLPADASALSRKEIAQAVADVCRQCSSDNGDPEKNVTETTDLEIIMTLVDDPELVDELKITGLHLSSANPSVVKAVRQRLGAHAILGMECITPDEALAVKPLDIDYITVPVNGDKAVLDRFMGIVEIINGSGHRLHIVAKGNFTPEEEKLLLAAGAAGFAVSK